jgi:hypothetical protein
MQRPIWIAVFLAACAQPPSESVPPEESARVAAEVRACMNDVACVLQRMVVGPAAYASSDVEPGVRDLPVLALPKLGFDLLVTAHQPPLARPLGDEPAHERLLAILGMGALASQLLDAVAVAMLESDLPQLAKQQVAARMIELGAERPETFAVLEAGLLSGDRTAVVDAARSIEALADELPSAMRVVYATLLREHGLPTARLE